MLIDSVSGDLVAQANACTGADQFQRVLLEQLARVAPYDSAIYLPRSNVERPTVLGKPTRYNEIYRRFRVGEAGYFRDLARAQAVAARDGAYLDSEIYSLAERRSLGFFVEILAPQHITSRLVVHVAFRGRVMAAVNLGRHGRSPAFQRGDLELMQRLAPLVGLTCAAVESRPEARAADGTLAELRPRELEIVQYLRSGYRNREIAKLLQLSPHTVRNQLARIFGKLRVHSRAELAALVERARR